MKNIVLWTCLCTSVSAAAQLPFPFQNLPDEEIASGIFLPLSRIEGLNVPDGIDDPPLDYNSALQVMYAMQRSSLDSTWIDKPDDLMRKGAVGKMQQLSIPLRIVDADFQTLPLSAIEEGLVSMTDSGLVDLTGSLPLFTSGHCALFMPDRERYTTGTYVFRLNTSDFFSNIPGPVDIEIDFDDGLGFRHFDFGQSYEVSYEHHNTDRHLVCKLTRGSSVRFMTYILRSSGGGDPVLSLQLPTWPTATPSFPWQISVEGSEGPLFANAYTSFSADGVFDKPFIFVEGIDFGMEKDPQRNGDFGWHEFSCGDADGYEFLSKMPDLLLPLHEEGYDIILLDFEDGAASMRENVFLVEHLLHLVNSHKTGTEENILAGASMGAVLSRMALVNMEQSGTPHCTRLWISLDGPHTGAHVPMGLQTAIETFTSFSVDAFLFKHLYLLRPAARELLISQLYGNEIHNAFLADLDAMGYPQNARGVGITNGSLTGTQLPYYPGAPILDYTCDLGPWTLFSLRINATPGDPNDQVNGNWVVSRMKKWQTSNLFGSTPETVYALDPDLYPGIDNVAGGMRTSMIDFVTAMNKQLNDLGFWNNLFDVCDTEVDLTDFQPQHCFIPTKSALGLPVSTFYTPVNALLQDSPELLPFDRMYGPMDLNMTHSELNDAIVQLVLEEVISGEGVADANVSAALPAGFFNYALPQRYVVHSAEVFDGGTLFINGASLIHDGTSGLYAPAGAHLEARTALCGSTIQVYEGGAMIIGDPSNGRTADFTITAGAQLRFYPGSSLIINTGCSLIIEKGAEVLFDGGEVQVLDGGKIIIEEQAVLHIASAEPIRLTGTEATIDVHGSVQVVGTDVLASILCDGSEGGKVRFWSSLPTVLGDASNGLKISGTGWNDKIIEVAPGAGLWTSSGFGKMTISNGKVTIAEGGKVTSSGPFSAIDVAFEGSNPFGLRCWHNASIQGCRFNNMKLFGNPGPRLFRVSDSEFMYSSIDIHDGGFRASNSDFFNTDIQLATMLFSSHVTNCLFSSSQDGLTAIADDSATRLFVKNCGFEGYHTAIEKQNGGELRLRCSEIAFCQTGVRIMNLSRLNLSAPLGGGYNSFGQNTTHVHLDMAGDLLLTEGYNSFGVASGPLFFGTLAGDCGGACMFTLDALHNDWGALGFPLWDEPTVFVADPACPGFNPMEYPYGCAVLFSDKQPATGISCGMNDVPGPVVKPAVKALVLPDDGFEITVLSGLFEGVPLSDALWYCRQPEVADPEKWYLDLFKAKISARPALARAMLATGVNDLVDLILLQEIAPSPKTLEALNALNMKLFDEPYLSASLDLEMVKARLCRINEAVDASVDIAMGAAQCGMSEAGEELIHAFLQSTVSDEVRTEWIKADSLWKIPVLFSAPEAPDFYRFGSEVFSDFSVKIAGCQENIKSYVSDIQPFMGLYPNPADESIFLTFPNSQVGRITVYDARGMLVLEEILTSETSLVQLNTAKLEPGAYVVVFTDSAAREQLRFVKQ